MTGEKKGLGAAYVRGMRHAIDKQKAEVFFEMDADLSHDPFLIADFMKKIEEGNDLVIGSRYMKGGSIPSNWAFHRKLFSLFGNLIVRFGLMMPGLKEWTSGYRAIRVEVFETIKRINERHKTAVLVVEHNVKSLFEIVNRAYVLDKGMVVAEGKPRELIASGIFEKVLLGKASKVRP